MKNLDWKDYGVVVNGNYLTHLAFADDIILVSENTKDLQYMLNSLQNVSKEIGREMKLQKTKIMTNSNKKNIHIGTETIEYVDNYIYLGKQISFKNTNNIEEIERRITKTWKKFWSLKEILKSSVSLHLKKKVMDSCLLPSLTYGSQTWT